MLECPWLLRGLLVLALSVGLSGCPPTILTLGVGTGPRMNAGPDEPARAVKLNIYHLTVVPSGLAEASCSDLQGPRPEILGNFLVPDSYSHPSVVPRDGGRPIQVNRFADEKFLLVVPGFYECRDDLDRWVLFPLDRSTDLLEFGMNGYGIKLRRGYQAWSNRTIRRLLGRSRR